MASGSSTPRRARRSCSTAASGENERLTLQSVRAYVEAQREYATKDRDGDEVLEYAQKFMQHPRHERRALLAAGSRRRDQSARPARRPGAGPGLQEKAQEEGAEPRAVPRLFLQDPHPPGQVRARGKYNYIINGNMIGGFALVAWPAEYGESGIMTFIVNQQGRVYQKDLGPKTAKMAADMKAYDPDKTWTVSPD